MEQRTSGAAGNAALRRLAMPVQRRLVGAMVTSGAGAAAWVAGVVLLVTALRELMTDASGGPDRTVVWWAIGLAAVAVLARFVLRVVGSSISHHASFDLETILRTHLVDHVAKLPLGDVRRIGSGGLTKVIQDDVRRLHAVVADITPMAGYAIAAPIVGLVAMVLIDWRLTLATMALVPLIVVGMRMAMRDYPQLRSQFDEANEAINAEVVEFVQGMQVVRVFDDGTATSRRFHQRVDEFTDVLEHWTNSTKSSSLFSRVAMGPLPCLLVIATVGTWLVGRGSADVADLVVFFVLGTNVLDAVQPIMWLTHLIQESKASALRICEVLDMDEMPVAASPVTPRDGSIRFRDVTFRYDGSRRPALEGLDLDIPSGTVCALVGSSGAGKSTVARLIPRFWDVSEGAIEVGGVDVRQIDPGELLRHVAIVFQEPQLLHVSIRDNIAIGRPDATDAEVEAAARAAQAHEFIVSELPDGYRTIVGERGADLSGGQRQRITIARAILSPAAIVVLDEATAFADPEHEVAIQDAIAELTRGRTIVVIAHRLSTIVSADQIVVIDAGRVAEHGTHDELITAGGTYAHLWSQHQQARTWGLTRRTATAEQERTS